MKITIYGWSTRRRGGLDPDVLQTVPPVAWTRLESFADTADAQRQLFQQAVRSFTRWYGTTAPAVTLAPLSGAVPIVLLHAAAAVAVYEQHTGPLDVDTALRRLFTIEEEAWLASVAEHPGLAGLDADTLAAAVCAAVLVGAQTQEVAEALLTGLPGLRRANTLRRELALWLRRVYPQGPDGWLDPHLPARLVERYVAQCLAQRPPLAVALAAVALAADRTARTLTTLAHAARHTSAAHQVVALVIGHDPARMLPAALAVALAGAGPIDHDIAGVVASLTTLTDDDLRALAQATPYPTQALVHTGLAIVRKRVIRATADESRAALLSELGMRLSALGRHDEALTATKEAVSIYRMLAATNPDAHNPNLAKSLSNLGIPLRDLGRYEDAVDIYRMLAATNPDVHNPSLANSLRNLGVRLGDLGRYEEALAATEEAVSNYRTLAATNPDAYNPNLAGSLNSLGIRLGELGRHKDALAAIREAVAIYQRLYSRWPDAFRGRLATAEKRHRALQAAVGRTPDEPTPPLVS